MTCVRHCFILTHGADGNRTHLSSRAARPTLPVVASGAAALRTCRHRRRCLVTPPIATTALQGHDGNGVAAAVRRMTLLLLPCSGCASRQLRGRARPPFKNHDDLALQDAHLLYLCVSGDDVQVHHPRGRAARCGAATSAATFCGERTVSLVASLWPARHVGDGPPGLRGAPCATVGRQWAPPA